MKKAIAALLVSSLLAGYRAPQHQQKLCILVNTQSCTNCYLYAIHLRAVRIPIVLVYAKKDGYQAKKFTKEVLKLDAVSDTVSDVLYNRLNSGLYGGSTCFLTDSLYRVKHSYQLEQLPEYLAKINAN